MAARMSSLAIDRSLLRAGERVCVAISGGADSVALLLAMVEAKASLGVGLSAAHVHHGLRGTEADADEAFVVALCERLGIPLTVFRVDTAARQAAEGEGVEEAARELRYAALRGLMASGALDVVVTAHTLDDQAETVMMKLLRGAWTEGLGGISPEVHEKPAANNQQGTAGRVVRPMLRVRRAEIEAFLREREQAWCEDATNADVAMMRNRVRHELMPMLRSFNPVADEMLANVAELARDEQAYWNAEVGRLLPMLLLPGRPVRGGGRAVGTAAGEAAVALELERLRGLSAAMRRRLVRAAAKSVGYRLSFEETAKVLALAGFGGYEGVTGRVGSRLELRGGLRAERSARELRLWRT
jgi:tRNA(Ile)-lysidine synthase